MKRIVLSVWTFIGIAFLVGFGLSQIHHKQPVFIVPVKAEAPAFVVDPRIVQVADQLGIDRNNLVKTKAQFGDTTVACHKSWAQGCFTGIITLSEAEMTNPLVFRTELAHEYLHWVWQNKRTPRTTELVRAFYLSYQTQFDYRMRQYANAGITPGSDQYLNEVHSFAGTEISDWRLSPELLAWYKQWLPNRNVLPSYY